MLPDTMSLTDKDVFESVLSSMTMMQDQEVVAEIREPTAPPEEREVIPSEGETKEDESTSAKISKGIAVGKLFYNSSNQKKEIKYFQIIFQNYEILTIQCYFAKI